MQREAKSKAQVLGHGFIAALHAPPRTAPPHPFSHHLLAASLALAPRLHGGFVLQILVARHRVSAQNFTK